LFNHCLVLSASATAAPAFVAAALYRDDTHRFILADRVYGLRQAGPSDPGVVTPIARLYEDGAVSLFPEDDAPCLCLMDEGVEPLFGGADTETNSAAPERFWPRLRRALRNPLPSAMIDRRLIYLAVFALFLAVISTLALNSYQHFGIADAVFYTITFMTTEGSSDARLRDAPTAIKLFGATMTLIGAITLAAFYAVITDTLVKARFEGLRDRFGRLRRHVIVSGLGNVGFRIADQLAKLGVPVAAVELKESNPYIEAARQLGIPVLIADTRLPSTLKTLHAERASCLIAATDDDVANLETVLNGRSIKGDLRVIMRLFDPDFAERVQRSFNIDACRSVSALAAPAFAAAATGLPVIATLPVGSEVLVVARIRVAQNTGLTDCTVGELETACRCRILVCDEDDKLPSHLSSQTILPTGSEIIVVGSHEGMSKLWARNRPGAVQGSAPSS
jgi:Trk K+ transport system NAD-binding subunit